MHRLFRLFNFQKAKNDVYKETFSFANKIININKFNKKQFFKKTNFLNKRDTGPKDYYSKNYF